MAKENSKVIHGEFQTEYAKATMWIALNKGLFAQLMYALVNEVSTGVVPTAATSGVKRFFDKAFMDGQNYKQQAFIMAHEIMHEMLQHKPRMDRRDHELWNIACDCKINNMLIQCGFERPTTGIFDYQGEAFHNKSEEFIYDFLEEEQEKGKNPIPEGYAGDLVGDDMTPDQIAQAVGRLQNAVEMHGHGNLPAELQGAINAILQPKDKWYDTLRRYFINKSFSGCDWTSMCRREFARTGLVSPPFQSDSLGTVVISVDQSGSISQEILNHFAGHINSILMDCKPARVVVQYFDTVIHSEDVFEVSDLPIQLRHVCGGGTSFVDCCEKAEDHEAIVHLVFTDCEGGFPKNTTTVPTIWCDFQGGHDVPFGEYLHIEME